MYEKLLTTRKGGKMIELENVTKTYKVSKRDAGIKNAFKSYFKREYTEVKALENISFNINEGEMVWIHWTEWSWKVYYN